MIKARSLRSQIPVMVFQKKVRTSSGESQIQVPRDRNASLNPMIVPKRGNIVDGIENAIISLYAKGMSNSDIEEQIREVYKFELEINIEKS